MTTATLTAELAHQPDPPQDRRTLPTPERIAEILAILSILASYGRHLAATLERRATWPGFATIAQFFGTPTIATIRAHILRGLMRAIALERVLRERAKSGRDLVVPPPRGYAARTAQPAVPPSTEQAPDPTTQAQPAEAPPAQQKAARPAARPEPDEPLTLDTLQSMEHYEAEARRRPVGRSIAAICRDLGVAPSLCAGPFWDRLFMAIHHHRGNGSGVFTEMRRREIQFEKDDWKHPKNLGLPESTREGIRKVLGFFIGEPPVDPYRPAPPPGVPVPATATGPP